MYGSAEQLAEKRAVLQGHGLKQLAEKVEGQRWDGVFSQNGSGHYFWMGGESSFVDFRMLKASATCCGVNLVVQHRGFFAFYPQAVESGALSKHRVSCAIWIRVVPGYEIWIRRDLTSWVGRPGWGTAPPKMEHGSTLGWGR